MNSIVLKVLSLVPGFTKYWNLLRWLLAETGWQRDVALWLASENQWYFKLAASAWGELYVADPNSLKPVLRAEASHPLARSKRSRR